MNSVKSGESKQLLFISHSSKDFDQAQRVVQELEKRGVRCWIAPREIEVSEDYAERLVSALKSSTATLVLISDNMLKSRHVRREIEIAHEESHTFYAVRLLDIELADQLNYFLKAGRWIDLFQGHDTANFDELASRVLQDEEISARKVQKRRLFSWAVLLILLLAFLIMGGLALMRLQSLDSAITEIAGDTDTPGPHEEVWVSVYFNQKQDDLYLEYPQTASIQLYKLPGFTGRLDATLYNGSSLEGLRAIGRWDGQATRLEEDNYSFELEVVDETSEFTFCARYLAASDDGPEQSTIVVYRHSPFPLKGKPVIVTEVSGGTTCEGHLGVGLNAEDRKVLETRQFNRHVLAEVGVMRLVRVAGNARSPDKAWMNFDTTSSNALLPSVVTFYLETGDTPDGLTESDVVRFRPDNRSYATFVYERPLGDYVRVCATTRVPNSELSVHDVSFYRHAEGTFAPLRELSGPVVNTNRNYCRTGQSGAAIRGPSAEVVDFWKGPLPEGSGRLNFTLEGPDRYGWGGFWVGMPFDDALKRARMLLPRAHETEAERVDSLYSAGILLGRAITIEDKMTGRKIGLVAYPDDDRLAVFSVRNRYPLEELYGHDLLPKMEEAYGRLSKQRKAQHPESYEAFWPLTASRDCTIPALGATGPVGIEIAPSQNACPHQVHMDVYIWRSQNEGRFIFLLANFGDLLRDYGR